MGLLLEMNLVLRYKNIQSKIPRLIPKLKGKINDQGKFEKVKTIRGDRFLVKLRSFHF